jgi:hypothetical protein
MAMPGDIEKKCDDIIYVMSTLRDPRQMERIKIDLPEGTRQILLIKEYNLINANWIDGGKKDSRAAILLTGHHSPSSEVTSGNILFLPRGEVRTPDYDRDRKTLVLFFDIALLQATVEQLSYRHRYAWIGHFSGGHIYGDIHASPTD